MNAPTPAPPPGPPAPPARRRALAWVVAAVLAAGLLWAWQALDLGRWLTLEQLKASRDALTGAYAARPVATAAGFFIVYVLATALSVPGAVVLTLAGGAMFGFGPGLVLVSFASSLGALLAFLAARYLLRDAVQARFGARLAALNEGIRRDGAWYLATLRLVPLFPFWLVNLAMGLTPIGAARYYGVSQLAMLPGTAVYVLAGTQLASVSSLKDVLSPGLLGSFVLLGLFPLLAKWAVDRARQRRLTARWPRPRRFDRNLVVIGAGSGGLVTAYIAAAVKAKVTLVEAHRMGGDCLNTGCVPSKALLRAAKAAHQARQAAALGVTSGPVQVDFAAVMRRVHGVVDAIAPHDSVERYTGLGVEVLQGHARITSPWTVSVTAPDGSSQTLSTRNIVIAAGAHPLVPKLPGLDQVPLLTSDTVWSLTALPRRLLVLGGGPVGCELAQAFARLGAEVTLVEQAPRLLIREDPDAAALVAEALEADGVRLYTGCTALRAERRDDGPRLVVRRGAAAAPGGAGPASASAAAGAAGATGTSAQPGAEAADELALPFDQLLCAVGREARVSGYGLEELGIPLTPRGTVQTDEQLRTLYPHIFAVGDVTGPYQLTHAAAHQAWYAAVNALFGDWKSFRVDYRVLPWCTYTDPEVARVGLNETEARALGIAHEVTRYGLDDLDRAIADGSAHGFVKVLTPPGRDTILGVTIVGAHASDLLAEWVLAMKHGLGLNKILGTVHAYPTMAESAKYAAGAWKRAHAPERLLGWVARYHAWRRG